MSILEIPLTRGYTATIDAADADRVLAFRWHVMVNKRSAYARRTLSWSNGKRPCLLLHRFIVGVTDPELHVDHVDGNGLNNLRSNLRVCSRTQNLANSKRGADNRTGFKGVGYSSRLGRFHARICINGRQRYLGSYPTPQEAHAAYCRAAAEAYGEFARYE